MEKKIVELLKGICEKFPEKYEDIDLLTDGYMDSLGIISFISEMDDKYGIEIDVDDVIPDNFRSVAAITALAEKYLGGN